jgi:prephenate dehydrogenase
MAGRAISGPNAAQSDLFEGATWIITPLDSDPEQEANDTVRSLIAACGAIAIQRTPEEHDAGVALVSHLTQIVSSALSQQLVGRAQELELSGPALRDITRLGSSDPDLWTGILSANTGPVLERLQDYQKSIGEYVAALEATQAGDATALRALLTSGGIGRSNLEEIIARRQA